MDDEDPVIVRIHQFQTPPPPPRYAYLNWFLLGVTVGAYLGGGLAIGTMLTVWLLRAR